MATETLTARYDKRQQQGHHWQDQCRGACCTPLAPHHCRLAVTRALGRHFEQGCELACFPFSKCIENRTETHYIRVRARTQLRARRTRSWRPAGKTGGGKQTKEATTPSLSDERGAAPSLQHSPRADASRRRWGDGVDGAVGFVVGWVAEVTRGGRGGQQQAQPSATTAGQLQRSPRADASRRRWGMERMEWMERIARWFQERQDELANGKT